MQSRDDPKLPTPSGMQRIWSRFLLRPRSTANRYLMSIVVCLVSLLLVELSQRLQGEPVTSFAVLSVIFSALYGGLAPAVLNTVISTLAVDYFYVDPGQIFESVGSFFR